MKDTKGHRSREFKDAAASHSSAVRVYLCGDGTQDTDAGVGRSNLNLKITTLNMDYLSMQSLIICIMYQSSLLKKW